MQYLDGVKPPRWNAENGLNVAISVARVTREPNAAKLGHGVAVANVVIMRDLSQ